MKKTVIILSVLVGLAVLMYPPQVNAITAPEKIQNGGFEQPWTADQTTANLWNNFHNGFVRTNETAHSGSWSARVQNSNTSSIAGTFQRIDLNQTSVKPVFIGGFVKGSNISMASGSIFGASMYAEIHLTDGSVMYWNSVPNSGTFDWRWIGFNTGSGFTTATGLIKLDKPIAYIYVVGILGNASGTAYFDDITAQDFAPSAPALTFMFDDGNETDRTVAKLMLDKKGYKASAAVITNEVGNEGKMTWEQIKQLAAWGWDIQSHTMSHADLTTLSSTQTETELTGSKSALSAQGISSQGIAYPFGAYNAAILAQTQKHYSSARPFETGHNPIGVFPYTTKVRSVTNNTTVADVNNWINEAKRDGSWIVLAFHEIRDTGDDIYHTSPAVFQSIIDAVAQSGIRVMTYNQGVAAYGVTQTNSPVPPPPPPPPPPNPNPTPTPTPTCSATSTAELTVVAFGTSTATVRNRSTNCSYRIGLASYRVYDNIGANQRIVSADTQTILPGRTMTLKVGTPSCKYQLDLFVGELIARFSSTNIYGPRLLRASTSSHPYCRNATTTTSSTSTSTSISSSTSTSSSTSSSSSTSTATGSDEN